MTQPVARIGDAVSHGGQVTSGSPNVEANGKPVARVGDKALCTVHGTVTIVDGNDHWPVNGKPVARVGSKCSCGAVITAGSLSHGGQGRAGAKAGPAGAVGPHRRDCGCRRLRAHPCWLRAGLDRLAEAAVAYAGLARAALPFSTKIDKYGLKKWSERIRYLSFVSDTENLCFLRQPSPPECVPK
jgi:uncharacterized Zn-binding protein involved in type VI secretion